MWDEQGPFDGKPRELGRLPSPQEAGGLLLPTTRKGVSQNVGTGCIIRVSRWLVKSSEVQWARGVAARGSVFEGDRSPFSMRVEASKV